MTVVEGIVVHAETLCEREDLLWDVIQRLSIPVSELEDARDQNRVTYGTDEMFRALLFMGVRGISQKKLAARLGQSPALTKSFQFDITDPSNTQQDLSYTHGKFSEDTQGVLDRTVAGVRQAALDHGVITEGLVPTSPTELEERERVQEGERPEDADARSKARPSRV